MNLQELALRYGADVTEEAYNEAVRRGAQNPLGYAESILKNRAPAAPDKPPAKLLCDACGRPSWVNDMVVRDGFGICSRCYGVVGPALVEDNKLPTPTALLVTRHWQQVAP